MPTKKISDKHKLFCKALLKHKFNQTKAYSEVYPKANKDTARNNASTLLAKTSTQEYLSKLTEKQETKELVKVEEVLNNIKLALENDMRTDDKGNMNTNGIYKGSELLGKYKSMWKDNINLEGNVRNILSFEDAVKAKKAK